MLRSVKKGLEPNGLNDYEYVCHNRQWWKGFLSQLTSKCGGKANILRIETSNDAFPSAIMRSKLLDESLLFFSCNAALPNQPIDAHSNGYFPQSDLTYPPALRRPIINKMGKRKLPDQLIASKKAQKTRSSSSHMAPMTDIAVELMELNAEKSPLLRLPEVIR